MSCFVNEEKMNHIWTFAGDPNYFPYEGMKCDCGYREYHRPSSADTIVNVTTSTTSSVTRKLNDIQSTFT